MSELPEKLAVIRIHSAEGINGEGYTNADLEEETLKRYNAYPDQQGLIKKLKEALSPFVSFKVFLDALLECEKEGPMKEYDSIVQIMGCGGSDNIWYKDFIIADDALAAAEKMKGLD